MSKEEERLDSGVREESVEPSVGYFTHYLACPALDASDKVMDGEVACRPPRI